jgi:cyanophycin synthetase
MEVYSAIQKFINNYHQNSVMPRSRLLRLSVLRELVVKAARRFGYEVVNADSLQEVYPGRVKGQVVYFSIYSDNPVVRRHLGAGGMAVFIRDGKVLVANGCRSRTLAKTKTNPHSRTDSSRLEDALAAAAGLTVLGVRPEDVWRGSGHDNPGFLYAGKAKEM